MTKKGVDAMNKRFHTDTRISENFTEDGLQSLTGQPIHNFLTYLAKEITDNSLEACDDPRIEIVTQTPQFNP